MFGVILLPILSILLVSSCKLKVKVDAETFHPVWAQFTFHNETKSKVYKFTDGHQNHTLYIEGFICNLKPTILKSYKRPPKPGVKPIGQTAAFIEGHGMVGYTIFHDDSPRMGTRVGVSCGFGDCGSRG
ncbi:hypothetical protein V3C99_009908 [Haemonchus contortus]